MIGGKVIETIVLDGRVWINVAETLDGEIRRAKKDGEIWETCAIYVENTPAARAVSEGDSVWWQGAHAMWTARDRHGHVLGTPDFKLKRIGFSGVIRPVVEAST